MVHIVRFTISINLVLVSTTYFVFISIILHSYNYHIHVIDVRFYNKDPLTSHISQALTLLVGLQLVALTHIVHSYYPLTNRAKIWYLSLVEDHFYRFYF